MKINDLKKDMDGRFDEANAQFNELLERFNACFDQTDQKIVAVEERTRRYMDVLIESVRTDLKLCFEKAMATDQKVSTNIIANAIEHAAFINALVNHDARIKTIESK